MTDAVIRTTQWCDSLGVELIIDPLGGGHWKKSYKVLCHTGRRGMFGVSTATESKLLDALQKQGWRRSGMGVEPGPFGSMMSAIDAPTQATHYQ